MGEIFLSLVFGLHLLAVDLAMAGPLVAVWLQWRAARQRNPALDQLARRLAGWSLTAAAVGIALGVAALALVPSGEALPYRRAIGLLDARRWWFLASELLFYFITAGAYVGLWRRMSSWPLCHRALAVVAATDLIYHFPPLFAVVSTISLQPKLWDAPLDHSRYWQVLLEGETISRVVHHWLAALAVGAVGAMLLSIRRTAAHSFSPLPVAGEGPDFGELSRTGVRGTEPAVPHPHPSPLPSREREQTHAAEEPNPAAQSGCRGAARIALLATLMQLLVGVWVLLTTPPVVQQQLLGEDMLSTILFGVSLLAALGLLHHLAVVALGDASRGAVLRSAALLLMTILLMVAMFHRARLCAFRQITQTTPQASALRNAHQLTTDN